MNFNRTVPVDTVLPHVTYQHVEAAIAWLTTVFGFQEHFRYGDPASGAQLHLGNAWIMVRASRENACSPAQCGFSTQSVTVFVDDVEDMHTRAAAAGATIVESPHETEYGEFQFAALDLEGHHWIFARHARDMAPNEWGGVLAYPADLPAKLTALLNVRRGAEAVEFYQRAFGAKVLHRMDDDKGEVVAELSIAGSSFWLADESPGHANPSPETLGGCSNRLVLVTPDPDAFFDRAVHAGCTVVCPVRNERYGWRIGRLKDPFGHHWEIGKPLAGAA